MIDLFLSALWAATAAPEQLRIVNISPFDVGVCFPRSVALPKPLNAEATTGAVRTLQPTVLECLVDPKTRGAAADTTVVIKTTVGPGAVSHEVGGTNLEAAGKACIEAALAKLKLAPLAEGAKAFTAESGFRHSGASASVKMGVNAASDVAGQIRIAQPTFCECLGTGSIPTTLKVDLTLKPGKPAEATSKSDDAVTRCLLPKLKAMDLKAATELQLPYSFIFIDSSSEVPGIHDAPQLQFMQLDAIRAQRSADAAIAVGQRIGAVTTYDSLVAKYNASKKPAKMVPEIRSRCADLVKADEALVSIAERQLAVDRATEEIAKTLAAKEPQWKPAQEAAAKQVEFDAKEVEKLKGVKAADQKVCPK